jgi:hypothetical protein
MYMGEGGRVMVEELCYKTDGLGFETRRSHSILYQFIYEFLAAKPEVRVRFPALPDFLSSSGSGTVCVHHISYIQVCVHHISYIKYAFITFRIYKYAFITFRILSMRSSHFVYISMRS